MNAIWSHPRLLMQYSDDWNKSFQKALDLPEETEKGCYQKWQRLTAVNRDVVATAVTFGKTIISEYFWPDGDKSIQGGRCSSMVPFLSVPRD